MCCLNFSITSDLASWTSCSFRVMFPPLCSGCDTPYRMSLVHRLQTVNMRSRRFANARAPFQQTKNIWKVPGWPVTITGTHLKYVAARFARSNYYYYYYLYKVLVRESSHVWACAVDANTTSNTCACDLWQWGQYPEGPVQRVPPSQVPQRLLEVQGHSPDGPSHLEGVLSMCVEMIAPIAKMGPN